MKTDMKNGLDSAGVGVSMKMKLGYSVGDLGANLAFQVTSFYLMFFFTDVFGIVPAMAGIIFLYSKLWDAVSDPLMGAIVDRTESRWGKMRPYLLFGAVPLGLAVFLLFAAPPIRPNLKFVYGLCTFIFFATAITAVNVPYLAMTPSLTLDSNERSEVTGVRVIFGLIGTLIAAGATLALVGLIGGGDQVTGFRRTGLLYALIVTGTTLITFFSVRERVAHEKKKRVCFRDGARVILTNRPFIILTAGVFMHMMAMNIMAVIVNYYFKYNLGAEGLISIAFLALFVTAAAFIPLFVVISKRTSKKFAYNLGMGIVFFGLILLFLFGEKTFRIGSITLPLTVVFLVLIGSGLSTNWLSPWSMIPDTVEYSEWKTGLRREGIIYGIFYFVFKFGTAAAGFLVGKVLDFTGYVANVEQTARALGGIRTLMTLVPMGFLAGGIILISLFPIDAAMHARITAEIRGRGEAE